MLATAPKFVDSVLNGLAGSGLLLLFLVAVPVAAVIVLAYRQLSGGNGSSGGFSRRQNRR